LDDGAEYVSKVRVYDTVSQSWSVVVPGVVNPPPHASPSAQLPKAKAAAVAAADAVSVDENEGSDDEEKTKTKKKKKKKPAAANSVPEGSPVGRFGHSALWLGTIDEAR
jgi:hypothetical protein